MDSSPCSVANNIYSPGSDKVTEVQMYMSNSCQPRSRVIRAFSELHSFFCFFFFFLFSDFAIKATKSENKKGFSISVKARISSRVHKFFFDTVAGGGGGEIATSD